MQRNTPALKKNSAQIAVHPTIAREMSLLEKAEDATDQAVNSIVNGELAAKECHVLLGGARSYNQTARNRLSSRLAAGRLALQEAKLITQAPA